MHHVEVKRRMAEADIAEVSDLLSAACANDGHRPLGEHKWLDLAEGGRAGFAGFVARDLSRGSALVGYAQLSRGSSSWAIERVVHPSARSDDGAVAIDLVKAALREVAAQGGGHVHLWVPKPDHGDDEVARQAGLVPGRALYQMRVKLPAPAGSPSIITRAFEPGRDEERWLDVNNRAFAAHPEQGDWSLETLRRREAEPWFDPEGFLVFEDKGLLIGSCWTKVHDDGAEPIGEIYVISVDGRYQGKGIGHQLLLAGLEILAKRGLGTAMLYVDSTNAPAMSLYRAVGFTIDHVDRAYVGDVLPDDAS